MVYDEKEKQAAFEKSVGNIEKCFLLLRLYIEYPKTFEEKAMREGYTKKQLKLFYQLQG